MADQIDHTLRLTVDERIVVAAVKFLESLTKLADRATAAIEAETKVTSK